MYPSDHFLTYSTYLANRPGTSPRVSREMACYDVASSACAALVESASWFAVHPKL
jgi:hypothetical protein